MAAANALSTIRHAQDGQYVSDTEPLISDGETAVMLNGGSESDGGNARAGGAVGGGGGGPGGSRGAGGGGSSSNGGGPFEIVQRMEMAQMADMFFSDWGRIFFYIALILYLFGDAAIYCTFVPRSLVAFFFPENPPPWAFDAFLVLFVAVIVPFCFFDFQKTKPLQIVTMVIRNAAITTMIVIAAWVAYSEGPRTTGVPNFRVTALPNLFGGAVYAFMCHHSLPGIITPMREKSFIRVVLLSAFLGVFLLYLLLFLSCGIAFGVGAEDPITFNFSPAKFGWIGDLLFLFPGPYLFLSQVRASSKVRATGAYAGAAVMFIIPACLVYRSRWILNQELPQDLDDSARRNEPHPLNQHASPFRSPLWVSSLVALAILVIAFISIDEILY
ncbi:unnamed protein product [Closterium sp. NIES-54]